MQDSELKEIETTAIGMTRAAGDMLLEYFGENLQVSFKKKGKRDPVTEADKASQSYMKEAIKRRFPEHGIVAEEDPGAEDLPAPDYVWVLDPLDGTINFLKGLPIYAVSVGVLFKGEPVAGCLFIPWPNRERGILLHARSGGGAFCGEDNLSLVESKDDPEGNQLIGLPSHFWSFFGLRKELKGRGGESRTTGSIAYELAMVAQGVFQYAVHTRAHLWDVAGGAAVVLEAGGQVMVRKSKNNEWESLKSFFPNWPSNQTTLKEVREWTTPVMVSGAAGVAEFVAANLKRRSKLRRALARGFQRLRGK